MTLKDLDETLVKLKLDLNCDMGMAIRDRILTNHGKHILDSKEKVCSNCWLKDNRGCSKSCVWNNLPQDPVEASKFYLSRNNDVSLMSFVCLFVIPVYEKVSGEKNTMEKLSKLFAKMWKQQYGNTVEFTKC